MPDVILAVSFEASAVVTHADGTTDESGETQ
jgi:hypothetical protein